MRFMVMVKADKDSEAGVMPTEKLLAEMGKFNEELVKAGVMLAGEGLHPSSKGARVRFAGDKRTVIDGPFAETKELVAGFWLWQVKSKEEAIEWVKRCPNPIAGRVARSRSARCSRPRTSAPSSRPSCGSRKSGCARRCDPERRIDAGRGDTTMRFMMLMIPEGLRDRPAKPGTMPDAEARRRDDEVQRGAPEGRRAARARRAAPAVDGRARVVRRRQAEGHRRPVSRRRRKCSAATG